LDSDKKPEHRELFLKSTGMRGFFNVKVYFAFGLSAGFFRDFTEHTDYR
jgi:hypothetical protein